MKGNKHILLLLGLFLFTPRLALSAEHNLMIPQGIQIGIGTFDVVKRVNRAITGDFRLIGPAYSKYWSLAAGYGQNFEGPNWIYVGTQGEFFPKKPYGLSLLLSASYYNAAGKAELGSKLEFFESLEWYYKLNDRYSIGLALQHLSNADIGFTNPGVENVLIIFRIR